MLPRSRQRSAAASGLDGESLQADVMRFMAIIGFCLIAIMGLVREATPPAQVAPVAAPVTEPEPMLEPVVEEVLEPVHEPVSQASAVVAVEQVEPTIAAPESAPRSADAQHRNPQPRPETGPEPVADLAPTTQSAEEGLTLRFNSDRDFLRLVSGGDVALYLFGSERAYRLERDYALRETQSPAQLYELMPQTIPAGIRLAAMRVVSDVAEFNWGVAMPTRIARQITSLVQTKTSGQLVIDRFGSVRHEQVAPNAGVNVGEQGQ